MNTFEELPLMEQCIDVNVPDEGCPAARLCPFKTVCVLYADASSEPLRPRQITSEKGQTQVVNPGSDQLVYVFQSGFYAIEGEAEPGTKMPFALYGEGIVAGVVELYATRRVSDTYNIYTLLPGKVCALHSEDVRTKLASLPAEHAQRMISCGLMNQFSAIFALMRIRERSYIYDQIIALFNFFMEFIPAHGMKETILELTQEEVASIINANRMAVSRVLRKMQEDGLIECSYKTIMVTRDALPQATYQLSDDFVSVEDGLGTTKAESSDS